MKNTRRNQSAGVNFLNQLFTLVVFQDWLLLIVKLVILVKVLLVVNITG